MTVLSGLQRGWVRNADANIEGDTTTASTNEQQRAEETGGKQKPSKQLAQNMRFRIVVSTLCPLALQGSSTLLPGLGLLPSAGRHALVPVALLAHLEPGGSRGPVVEDKEPQECLVWSLGHGVGVTEIFLGVGAGHTLTSTPNGTQHCLVGPSHERVYCSLRPFSSQMRLAYFPADS